MTKLMKPMLTSVMSRMLIKHYSSIAGVSHVTLQVLLAVALQTMATIMNSRQELVTSEGLAAAELEAATYFHIMYSILKHKESGRPRKLI